MTTVLNVKIDDKLKKEAQEVAKAVGLPMSTVVAASLKEFVRTRSVTFSDLPGLKPAIEKELAEHIRKAESGKDLSPEFDNVEDALAWLHK